MNSLYPHDTISSTYVVDSSKEGPSVCIFSGIHGDEKSGIKANERLLKSITNGEIKILKGKLTLVINANEEAIKVGKRQIEKNMNRLFHSDLKDSKCYEESRVIELMGLLNKSDYLLDLHSTSGPSIPFAFAENHVIDLALKMGISHVISGWGELDGSLVSGDTENYINIKGGKGITFEAGDHNYSQGEESAYKVILNFLVALGLLDITHFQIIEGKKSYSKITSVYIAKSNNFKYEVSIDNFQKIPMGTLIGTDNGVPVYAEEDIIFIMPKSEKIIKKGVEVFFMGEEII